MGPWPEPEGGACPGLTSRRGSSERAAPAIRTPSCSTGPHPASDCAFILRGRKVCIAQARIKGRSRRIVIAQYNEMEPAEAAAQTTSSLASAPARSPPRISAGRKRPRPSTSSRKNPYAGASLTRIRRDARPYASTLKTCILPALGRTPLDHIGPEDGAVWFDAASRDRRGTATTPSRYGAR